jgi:putative ABC transport system substrate-binding protein
MAEELVRLPVDVIVADRPAVLFAQEATRTIPIIGAVSRDPVATGLIRSFAQSGRQYHRLLLIWGRTQR